MKAILNNEVIELNELTETQVEKIPSDQRTKHNNKWYFNPDGAVIAEDMIPPPSPYHKWNGTEWIPDASKRQEILAKLTKLFNKETETLIHDSEITFENVNGAITLKCDETNQKNFTAAYTARDILEFPFNIWEGDQELELQAENELKQVCSLIFSTVEGVRRTRKEIRDTFKDKTTSELIELLKEHE